jgi:hypothetical protein
VESIAGFLLLAEGLMRLEKIQALLTPLINPKA